MSATSARAEQAEMEAASASEDHGIEGADGPGADPDFASSDDGAGEVETPAPAPAGPSAEELGQRLNGAVQALQQARAQARELRQQLAHARQAQGYQPAQGLEIPDPEEDPIAALSAIRHLALQQQYEAETAEQHRQQIEAQHHYIGALQEETRMDEAVFRTVQPDYDHALTFLAQHRGQELAALGYSQAEIANQIGTEVMQTIDHALARGLSPAKIAYDIARSRGYRPHGQQASALHAIQRGQQAARTLSGAGGRPPGSDAAPEERLSGLNGAALRDAWRKIKAERNAA
jgi:hypothetical protein